jgi:hypothetical protein
MNIVRLTNTIVDRQLYRNHLKSFAVPVGTGRDLSCPHHHHRTGRDLSLHINEFILRQLLFPIKMI